MWNLKTGVKIKPQLQSCVQARCTTESEHSYGVPEETPGKQSKHSLRILWEKFEVEQGGIHALIHNSL